jgi:hypothetical protein
MGQPLGITDVVAAIALGAIDADFPVTTPIDVSSKVVYKGLLTTLGTFVPEFGVLPALRQLRDADIPLVGTRPKAASAKSRDDSAELLGISQYHFAIAIHVSNRPRFHVNISSSFNVIYLVHIVYYCSLLR